MDLLTGIFSDVLEEQRQAERDEALLRSRVTQALTRIEETRSLSPENPATPLSAPADWLFEALGGGFGVDGQLHVNEHSALQLNTVRACIRAIAEDVGTVPLHLYRQSGQDLQVAHTRNEYWLLHRQPNPNMTACIFREALTATCLLWGNAFAEIEYNGAGKITALWPINPAFVRVEILGGPERKPRYIVSDPNGGSERVILRDDMLHLKGTSMDGYMGLYTIRHHRVPIGLALALENFGLYYFLNGSRPGGVLESPKTLTPAAAARIRESWQHMFGGPRQANKVAVLEEGMKFSPLSINNDNAQYVENRKLAADEIARMFRVPPHVIGILEKATFSNIEHQSLDYVKSCLRPWFTRWEQELDTKIFPSERSYRFEHDEDGLLRGDFATRMNGYAQGRQWGWLSANDIRRHENLNPIGPEGDIYLTPLNMHDAAEPDEPAAPDADPKGAPIQTGGGADDGGTRASTPFCGLHADVVAGCDGCEARKAILLRPAMRPIFADAISRALHCSHESDRQRQRYISRTFTPVLVSMARALGHQAGAEVTARAYADRLHLRFEDWQAKTADVITAEEFELAWIAMTPAPADVSQVQ